MNTAPVLVVGATGYVGGRLVPLLLSSGYRVRAAARSVDKLAARGWGDHPGAELAAADVLDADALRRAAEGCRAAIYLVHSMTSSGEKFVDADRDAARNMVAAAEAEGLDRIIYLGGLGESGGGELSPHLSSRREVGEILQAGPVPTTVLRAGAILGAGSASFEILRYSVERFPVMLAPRWVRTRNQPIAIRNVLNYLRGCLEGDALRGGTFDIGGPDVLTYRRLAEIYAEEAGLPRRVIIPVPFVSPAIGAWLIHMLTPVPAGFARPLVEGIRNEAVCTEHRIRDLVPQELSSPREAIRMALRGDAESEGETCWSDAGCLLPPEWAYCGDAEYTGGTVMEVGYRAVLDGPPEKLWPVVTRLGGRTGYYFAQPLWRIRGWMDRIAGGPGLIRGRRDPVNLQVGDALDFWRVLAAEPSRRLHLLSEMRAPGDAVFEIDLEPAAEGGTELQLRSRFEPKGLGGLIYWYGLFPVHQMVFKGMLTAMADRAGCPVRSGPDRFTPAIPDACPPPWRW
jgi:uncharacterized protein YbjT (DUF2867 family)